MPVVRGEFDLKLTSQPAEPEGSFTGARILHEKRYHGALDGVSHGQMLVMGAHYGFGAYVVIEEVTGTLDGRRGTFILHHSGTMIPSADQQMTVALHSGTDELIGITGTLAIEITGGKHFYTLDYQLT
jgi:hypothetical protein